MSHSIIVQDQNRAEIARFANALAARDWLQRMGRDGNICRRVPVQTERGWAWRTIRLERFLAARAA
jgi:hypothetical protein